MWITVRKISKRIKEQIIERDGNCIICGGQIQQIHHVFYGLEANYWPDRNEANQLVWLCSSCHDKLHFNGGNDFREKSKQYLEKILTNEKI